MGLSLGGLVVSYLLWAYDVHGHMGQRALKPLCIGHGEHQEMACRVWGSPDALDV